MNDFFQHYFVTKKVLLIVAAVTLGVEAHQMVLEEQRFNKSLEEFKNETTHLAAFAHLWHYHSDGTPWCRGGHLGR